MPSSSDGNLTMRLDCSSSTWSHTADQPIPCTCPRKKIGAAADRIEACHQKFMLRRRRKTSQRFSRCSASREPLLSDPDAHGSHPTREAATSCGLSICRRLLYLVWLTLCERLTLVRSVPIYLTGTIPRYGTPLPGPGTIYTDGTARRLCWSLISRDTRTACKISHRCAYDT